MDTTQTGRELETTDIRLNVERGVLSLDVVAYITAFDSGNDGSMRAYFSEAVAVNSLQERPLEARLDVYRQLHTNLGVMDVLRVLAADDETSGRILIHGSTDE